MPLAVAILNAKSLTRFMANDWSYQLQSASVSVLTGTSGITVAPAYGICSTNFRMSHA